MGHILFNQSRPWLWHLVSSNRAIGLLSILEYPHLPWDLSGIFSRDDLSIEFLKRYKNIPESIWRDISKSIPLEEIVKDVSLPWNWNVISSRRDLNFEWDFKYV